MLPYPDLRLAQEIMAERRRQAELDGWIRKLRTARTNGATRPGEAPPPLPPALSGLVLPDGTVAAAPPEAEGREREDVRLLVVQRARRRFEHHRFTELPALLRPGDLVVFNASQTLPASVPVRRPTDGSRVRLHFSTCLDASRERWVVEVRAAEGTRPLDDAVRPAERFEAPDGTIVELLHRYRGFARLWEAEVHGRAMELMNRFGEPVRYGYVEAPWPLSAYQTAVGEVPGSAEMPSAARPFTHRILWELRRRGVELAKVLLHTGLSSHELRSGQAGPGAVYPEWYEIPASSAVQIDRALRQRRRVVAVGTTVVRALESAARARWGRVRVEATSGWTELFIGPGYLPRVVGAVVTGLHAPQTTHLAMMAALADPELLRAAYVDAMARGYRWHEFGDLCLIE
ncbi:S-adenosylmethionine:tRNA ribosyltransferase-isomerase [Carboxydochorda subterranea]|uniref:S-adenosylmethionine:tRNA ribosyltransferase-isomerase n=1 Tax=Carboxydichorda subterranea TaxID=3109565 RepID=A0ABZ1BZV4_9FIRM|nr:S-adenosylmethionine:tRNA ribosyltransferase-isomerase [Limnochorda sp. L945t]WRP18110.1 S-adenosylmethionine:tRNA ribosyltransferase-isomerase [Limnochorda sp. L945t]